MPGLSFSNELISQDKGLHCNFACLFYSKLVNRLPESWIVEIISSTVKIEMEFVPDALPVELIGMNSAMMCNYIKFCANRLLITLGCHRHYKVGNPFEWMETIS
jgi:ribonucleoside-diphosphate reductase subunit M2